jgi:membrane-associated protease RseP (regulator of RpoE activity)
MSEADGTEASPGAIHAPALARHLALFVATGCSMAVTYAVSDVGGPSARSSWVHGAEFAGALLLILLAHELGHYIAARLYGVDASLPFFIPLPFLSPFGTMGAVIRMRGTIPSRKALLDIGAAGPLAGLVFAIPLYAWGIRHSPVVPFDPSLDGTFGESLLSRALDAAFGPNVPDGSVVLASPVLLAAWAGLFVTMLNLIPIGQLDGGHVAYALLGKRQDRAAVVVHRALLVFFFVSLTSYVARDLSAGLGFVHLGKHVNDSLFWLVWFEIVAVLGSFTQDKPEIRRADDDTEVLAPGTRIAATVALAVFASMGREHPRPAMWAAWFVGLAILLAMEARGGSLRPHSLFRHPDVGQDDLGLVRSVIAVVALAFFVALFMPTPMSL